MKNEVVYQDLEQCKSELLDRFETRNLIIFCGAGISFQSGIMTVHPMIQYLLNFLSADESDIMAYLTGENGEFRLPIPFEAIIESLKGSLAFQNSSLSFIETFAGLFKGKENINHRLLAQLLQTGKVLSIVTTNFDTCIEQALGWESGDRRIIIPYAETPDILENVDIAGKLIKLHGCMSRPEYLGTTVEQITKTEYWTKTITILDKIFYADPSRTVLFLGYSCSDLWDVAEYFDNARLLNKELAPCIYWQHSSAEKITPNHNAYQMLCGHSCSFFGGDTDQLVSQLCGYEGIPVPDKVTFPKYNDFGAFIPKNPAFVLGNLFQDSSYFDLAIKYFTMALNNAESITEVYIKSICGISKMYEEKNNFNHALEVLKKAIQTVTPDDIQKYGPELIHMITQCADLLADTKDYSNAIKIYENLIDDISNGESNTLIPPLAHLYNDLSLVLQKQQDYKEAQENFEKALDIFREYAKENPQTYLPDVAMVLSNEAIMLNSLGAFKEAGKLYEESLEIRRKLAKANPFHLPSLATTLNNFAVSQNSIGNCTSANALLHEALEIRRTLARSDAKAYLPYVATTLMNQAACYRNLQYYEEAEQSCMEAVDIYLRLWETDTGSFSEEMAKALINLSGILVSEHRLDDALAFCKNAVDLCEELTRQNRNAFLPDLVLGYIMLATIYQYKNSFEAADEIYQKLLCLSDELVALNRPAYIEQRAKILFNYANANYENRRFQIAKELYESALKLFEELSTDYPDIYLHDVRRVLKILSDMEENDEDNISRWERIIFIDKKVAQKNPQRYLKNLAFDLRKFADAQRQSGYVYEPQEKYEEALQILENMNLDDSPEVVQAIIEILNCLGIVYYELEQYDEAIRSYRKALKYNEAYLSAAAEKYYYNVYMTYHNMSISQSSNENGKRQMLCLKKGISAARKLAVLNAEKYTPALIKELHHLAHVCYYNGMGEEAEKYLEEMEELRS